VDDEKDTEWFLVRLAIRQQFPHFQGGAVTQDHPRAPRLAREESGAHPRPGGG